MPPRHPKKEWVKGKVAVLRFAFSSAHALALFVSAAQDKYDWQKGREVLAGAPNAGPHFVCDGECLQHRSEADLSSYHSLPAGIPLQNHSPQRQLNRP